MIQCKSTGEWIACTLLPYLWVRILSLYREFSADMTAPQNVLLCKVFSAKSAAPEPSERWAVTGFYKRTILCLNLIKWLSFFERRQAYFVLQFFKISRYRLRSEKMCDERLLRCLKLLPSGAKRHLSKSCRYRNRNNTFCDYCCTIF